jgi:hypothetical protein
VEFTLLEGSSKGLEQLALFHSVGFPLEVEEARVLVTSRGIAYPEPPMVAVWSSLLSGVFCNSESTAEIIPLGGVTSFQEPGWESGVNGVGRGKWLVKWARKQLVVRSFREALLEGPRRDVAHEVFLAQPVGAICQASPGDELPYA